MGHGVHSGFGRSCAGILLERYEPERPLEKSSRYVHPQLIDTNGIYFQEQGNRAK